MGSRLAERVVTGPLAFFVAGVVDVAAFWAALVREAGRRRTEHRRARRRATRG